MNQNNIRGYINLQYKGITKIIKICNLRLTSSDIVCSNMNKSNLVTKTSVFNALIIFSTIFPVHEFTFDFAFYYDSLLIPCIFLLELRMTG